MRRFNALLKCMPAIEEITVAHGLFYLLSDVYDTSIDICVYAIDVYMNRKERKCIFAPGDIFPPEMSISLTDQTIVHY